MTKPHNESDGRFLLLKQQNRVASLSKVKEIKHNFVEKFHMFETRVTEKLGNRFVATRECEIHQRLKRAIIEADINETSLILRSYGEPERVYHNS